MPKSTKETPYHHGDLRQSLIDAALELIAQEQNAKTLSLRQVARQVGVSHTAPYRHFADKEELLAAVAEEGFRLLFDALQQSMANVDEPLEQLQLSGVAYVQFALSHPSHYRVMFGAFQANHPDYPALNEAGGKAFGVMVEAISTGQTLGKIKVSASQELAWVAWSLVHGLAMLLIEQQLPLKDEKAIIALTQLATASLTQGLRSDIDSKSNE